MFRKLVLSIFLILFVITPVLGQGRFGAIKDEQKIKNVEHVDELLSRLNQKQVTGLKAKADKMVEIHDLLEIQILALQTDGANVDELNIMMDLSQSNLDKLLADLELQQNKTYIPELLDESLVKQEVGESISLLKADLGVLSQDLFNVKDGLIKIVKQIISLRQLLNIVPVVSPTGAI